MKPSLQLKQGLQLSLTPQLQQAIHLLQLNSVELQQEVQQYLDSNPLLELVEAQESLQAEDSTNEQTDDSFEAVDLSADQLNNEYELEESWNHYSAEEQRYSGHTTAARIEQNASEPNLRQKLLWQINTLDFTDKETIAAYFIVDSLTSNGFLSQTPKEIFSALASQSEISFSEFESVRQRIQQLEPSGCASEGLSDFLLWQLIALPRHTDYRQDAIYLLKRHSHLLAKHDYALLQRRSRFDEQHLKAIITLIQSLKTEPYHSTAEQHNHYIEPDLYVSKQQGRWQVQLNDNKHIALQINPYYAGLAQQVKRSEDQQYIQNNLQEARWLIRSLNNRFDTLLKVAEKIIEYQQDFLEQGNIAMQPLTLAQIAQAIDMHESTVSRATTEKYIHTPQGVFELKYFFSSQINTETGSDCSSTAIRAMIKSMVAEENTQRPLSDNKIAQLLEQQGIQIARRTVAKYREELAIPPSNQRKRLT